MSQEMPDLVKLLKARQQFVVKRYEMSKATFRQLELQLADRLIPLKPNEQRATALWGIPIHFDNDLPFGEVKPVYA